jgi:hypothetical protein
VSPVALEELSASALSATVGGFIPSPDCSESSASPGGGWSPGTLEERMNGAGVGIAAGIYVISWVSFLDKAEVEPEAGTSLLSPCVNRALLDALHNTPKAIL